MAHGPLAEFEPEILFEGQYLGGEGLVAQGLEPRVAGVTLGVPFVGEPAGGDVVHELAHRRRHVEVVVATDSRQLAVLAGRRAVQRMRRAAFPSHEPVPALDSGGQELLGYDRPDRNALVPHDLQEQYATL